MKECGRSYYYRGNLWVCNRSKGHPGRHIEHLKYQDADFSWARKSQIKEKKPE